MENQRQSIELADIFRSRETDFLQNNNLCSEQIKAFKSITSCRTSTLGGHLDQCDNCGHVRPAYNSCRNRHCPKCQFIKKAKWVDKLAANLPPVKHFHVVFTIPAHLNRLFYLNQDNAYSLLFKAAGKTLMQCAANQNFLGAQAGAVAILHTWGQTLVYHPHIHMIVPAGGLSDDQTEWIRSGKKFFLPVKALSAVFRGVLCRLLEQGVEQGKLKLPDDTASFRQIKNLCYQKKWVVYCEKPFAGPQNLINYLGNYTHRVAISNHRIADFNDGKVTFSYKDYKTAGLSKTITLDADEFIRRFLQHVLPCGFYKIRYFGFMAICNIKTKLDLCFTLIEKPAYLP
ncbi:MAG: IS91 family transposase, partial [Bacteroidales bacterium]|nr:IS91 family transposase [Bacteroidales bacterium]